MGPVLLVKPHHQLAGTAHGHVQMGRQIGKQPVALHAQPGHKGAGSIVESGMDDAGIAGAGAAEQVRMGFGHRYAQMVTAQLPGHGAADDTGPDDGDIQWAVHGWSLLYSRISFPP